MKSNLNLLLAWLWILLGFVTGMVLGLFFHGENWLGGYASLKRRMYRLAHISFFGLGAVNLLFWLTIQTMSPSGSLTGIASWAFIIGAVTMPICCVVMAHFPKAYMIFAVPVLCLIAGGTLTLILVYTAVQLAPPASNTSSDTAHPNCRQVLECGGKRSATPLWGATGQPSVRPFQSGVTATALQDAAALDARRFALNLQPSTPNQP